MKKPTDKELIEGCRMKNLAAQKQLYNRYIDRLYYVVYRYVNDHYFTQNVLQDVFLKIFNHVDSYDENKGAFSTWINTIAVRTALNHTKKRKMFFQEIESVEVYQNGMIGSEEVLSKLAAEDILKIVGALPEKYRVIFNLYEIDGYSHKEISELLEIGESTSRSYLTRAKQYLQELITPYLSNENIADGKVKK